MKKHKEVPCKVNVFVDEGIKPLVEALSRNKEIVTVGSCEGYNPFKTMDDVAFVNFTIRECRYDANNKTILRLLNIAIKISKRLGEAGFNSVKLEWNHGLKHPVIRIWLEKRDIPLYTKIIRGIKWQTKS